MREGIGIFLSFLSKSKALLGLCSQYCWESFGFLDHGLWEIEKSSCGDGMHLIGTAKNILVGHIGIEGMKKSIICKYVHLCWKI